MDALKELQTWYQAQCNEDWEHTYGVQIGTLDNPGWFVTIDLTDTPLARRPFVTVEELKPKTDWISCKVLAGKFEGAGGPFKLEEILRIFLTWANQASI